MGSLDGSSEWTSPSLPVPISAAVGIPADSPSVSQISQRDDAVLIRGAALPLMYRAVLALIARRSRDGLGVTPLLQLARTTLVWRVGLAIVARNP